MSSPLVTVGPDVRHATWSTWSAISPRRPRRQVLLVLWLAVLGLVTPLLAIPSPHLQASNWLGTRGIALLRAFHARDVSVQAVLQCLQIAQPVLTPLGVVDSDGTLDEADSFHNGSKKSCSMVLMEHSFQNSYSHPFVGTYTPPSCEFNRVVLNFTAVSQGRQYDRLAVMYLGDTEVWRTSTAEPKKPPGIRWSYVKDMTPYLSLWKSPQKVIFDLGNIVNENYTGPYNTTLSATFFNSPVQVDTAPPSDLIIPISGRRSANGSTSEFTLPKEEATNVIDFPRNARRAVFSISAVGQADEESWWSNVLQSDVFTFNDTMGPLPGYSTFREIQLEIDGQLAGVQWPFPIIFTGGVVPGLHRPVVGLDAFDLEEHQIDITPFLPVLCDGAKHNFTLRVAGLDDDGGKTTTLTETVNSNWVLTGKIFVWTDPEGSITTGDKPKIQAYPPSITVSHHIGKLANGTNSTLEYTTQVERFFVVSGRVTTHNGTSVTSWSQILSYNNIGNYTDRGFNTINNLTTKGTDKATSGGGVNFSTSYAYPLFVNQTVNVTADNNFTLWGHMVQSKHTLVSGASVFPTGLEPFAAGGAVARTAGARFAAAIKATTKNGTAWYFKPHDAKPLDIRGSGEGTQMFVFGGMNTTGGLGSVPDVELYNRNNTVKNGSVVADRVVVAGRLARESQGKPGFQNGEPYEMK